MPHFFHEFTQRHKIMRGRNTTERARPRPCFDLLLLFKHSTLRLFDTERSRSTTEQHRVKLPWGLNAIFSLCRTTRTYLGSALVCVELEE